MNAQPIRGVAACPLLLSWDKAAPAGSGAVGQGSHLPGRALTGVPSKHMSHSFVTVSSSSYGPGLRPLAGRPCPQCTGAPCTPRTRGEPFLLSRLSHGPFPFPALPRAQRRWLTLLLFALIDFRG